MALVFSGTEFQRIVEAPNIVTNKAGLLAITIKKQPYELSASSDYFWIDISRPKLAKAEFTKAGLQQAKLTRLPRLGHNRPSLESLVDMINDYALKKRLNSLKAKPAQTQKGKLVLEVAGSFAAERRHHLPEFSTKAVMDRIPGYDASQLLQIWKNALRRKSQTYSSVELAKIASVIDLIENEWSARSYLPTEGSFRWPTTDAPNASHPIGSLDLAGEGMLSYLEYHVGRTHGLPSFERISILERVFEGKLPKVFADRYMAEWSVPKSPKRLQKVAECIAAFARNAKRRKDDKLDQAIREWEDDLEYLYNKFYVGHFHFSWPATALG